jgi:hypothetical protein
MRDRTALPSAPASRGDRLLSDTDPARTDLDERIAVIEDNLRDLLEQGAAYSGAGDEERSSDRIADFEQQLEALKKQRDARS